MTTYEINDIASLLGLTEKQVRTRIESIDKHFPKNFKRGLKNRILITGNGLKLLEQLQLLITEGHTISSAARELVESVERETVAQNEPTERSREVELLEALLKEKDARIENLQRQVERLQMQIDEISPRPLPGPLTTWWRRLFDRRPK